MFCPKCGKAEQTPNAYCRNCGEWLPDVNNLQRGRIKLPPEKRLKMMLIFNILSAVFAAIIAVALITSFLGREAVRPGVAVAIAFCFPIVAWQIVNFVLTFKFRHELKRRRQNARISETQLETAKFTGNILSAADTSQFAHPVTSVTENTTSLLEPVPVKKTNKFE